MCENPPPFCNLDNYLYFFFFKIRVINIIPLMIRVRLVVTLPLYNKLQTTLTVLCNMLKLDWCIGRAVKDDNLRGKKKSCGL